MSAMSPVATANYPNLLELRENLLLGSINTIENIAEENNRKWLGAGRDKVGASAARHQPDRELSNTKNPQGCGLVTLPTPIPSRRQQITALQ